MMNPFASGTEPGRYIGGAGRRESQLNSEQRQSRRGRPTRLVVDQEEQLGRGLRIATGRSGNDESPNSALPARMIQEMKHRANMIVTDW